MKTKTYRWVFYKDRRKKFRWKHFASNGREVGAACQGYSRRGDCKVNAYLHGWREHLATIYI